MVFGEGVEIGSMYKFWCILWVFVVGGVIELFDSEVVLFLLVVIVLILWVVNEIEFFIFRVVYLCMCDFDVIWVWVWELKCVFRFF